MNRLGKSAARGGGSPPTHTLPVVALAAVAMLTGESSAANGPYRLAAPPGDTFQRPAVLESLYEGDYTKVAYVPVTNPGNATDAAKPAIDPSIQGEELSFSAGGMDLQYVAVGKTSGPAKAIVVYLHGWGAGRSQGMDDTAFGGNFARIRKLMVHNGGVYLSPEFSGFGDKARGEIKALIAEYLVRSPGAPVFVACISRSGGLCWRLAEDPEAASQLAGVLLLSAPVDDAFLKAAALQDPTSKLPLYLGHGNKDVFSSWKSHEAFFKKIKDSDPAYPIRFTLFDGGEHGTAIRLTDWQGVINWMLAEGDKRVKATALSASAGFPCPRLNPRLHRTGSSACRAAR
jgi:hypothetical protein